MPVTSIGEGCKKTYADLNSQKFLCLRLVITTDPIKIILDCVVVSTPVKKRDN